MDRNIKLPARFLDKLNEDKKWMSYVEQSYRNVEDYFYRSPRFFPEYTNHGILHINRVIELCDCLIPEEAVINMKPRELGILMIAVIMHDIGMFIEKDGLQKLICGDRSAYRSFLYNSNIRNSKKGG